jgi:hypothetical protein
VDFWNVVAAAAAIVAIATVAGLGLQRGYTISLREQLGSAREEIEAQRGQIEVMKQERAEDRTLIAKQASDITTLQRVVTGEVHWQAISDLLDHHHAESQQHWVKAEQVLTEIRDYLRRSSA